ncbi:MAG TPA: TonB-dependent receptor [Verrucomicrobiae bacterium]|jgi:hypothetical protein|nr:TonB-dependent receptor [Verrucomicrobiae bacterium]
MSNRSIRTLVLMAASFLGSVVLAQDVTGNIAGSVKDASGAVISGATVTVINTDTNVIERKVTTGDAGRYVVPFLPIGHYRITVEKDGFSKATIEGIELNAHDELTENAALKVGATQQEVTVAANALHVELENAQAAGLIDSQQMTEIPLNNRNYEQLVILQPGVSYGGGDQLFVGTTNPSGQTNTVSFSINGQRNSGNNWTVDGADNVDRGSNLTLLAYPSVDAIAEFSTLRGNYNPEYGRSASGQIDVVTKSGTNRFHGDLYEFFRNDALNANNFLTNQAGLPRPPLRYNDFGYTIGGPVIVPGLLKATGKTFFFFSNEYYRIKTSATVTGTVPTANERLGIFPTPVCIAHNAAGACSAPPSNTVGAINPVAAAYLKDIINALPTPNDAPLGANTLVANLGSTFDHTQEIVKIDHMFGPRLSVFFRFINDSIPTIEPGGLFTASPLPGVSTTSTNSPGRNYLGHFTAPLSSSLVLDGGYTYSTGAIISDPTGSILSTRSPDIATALPFPSTLNRVPAVTFSGGSSLTGFGQYRDYDRNHNVFGNVSKTVGNHVLRAGISYHHYEKTENASGNNTGTFGFTNKGAPVGPSTYEQSFANFLTGFVTQFTQVSLDLTPDIKATQVEFYGQDQWHVRHNLTLSYGLRYSLFRQPMDANKFLTNFDPKLYDPTKAPTIDSNGNICTTGPCAGGGTPNPNFNPLNGVIVNGPGSPFGSQVGSTDTSNFAPRVGFAWDPFSTSKTSIRGGYGVFYDSTLFGIYEQNIFQNVPFVQNVSILNTQFATPAAVAPTLSLLPPSLRASPVSFQTPYNQEWNLDIQREINHNVLVDVGYYGSKATHLLGVADINQPLPGAYITAGLGTPTNEAKLNRIRPFLGYGPINQIATRFDSNYNSLQMAGRWQFTHNSMVSVSYTWSHALTDAQSDRSSAAQNSYNVSGEYGPSALDRRHVFSANYIYEMPFFRKRQDALGQVLGGWELSGLVTANTGLPLTALTTSSADPAGQGTALSTSAASLRPDQIGNPNAGGLTSFTQWFNTAAFANVPAGQFRPGNAGRGTILGPGYQRWDVALLKNFPVREGMRFQFRAEAFNVFNHTNFNTVGTTFGSSTFGKITGTRDPRIMQVALKFYF